MRNKVARHSSTFSVRSDYEYKSSNDLNLWQGAALLTADCLGTGILALPNNMKVLGWRVGLGFLVLNVPINLYAGTILSEAARSVEDRQKAENLEFLRNIDPNAQDIEASENEELLLSRLPSYRSISSQPSNRYLPNSLHHDTATFDFIGMTAALFQNPLAARLVMILFYANLVLVLGDYILVMSHAVSALFGESMLCIPVAGIFASTLMFAVSQLRTMANLGRTASLVSLSALFIVILQCLYYGRYDDSPETEDFDVVIAQAPAQEFGVLDKLSAIGSIGFAMGSQKLLLNIRHELADRDSAPMSLAVSLSAFASFYVLVVVFAGENPPSFLFDSIPPGLNRRIGGFFLWVHVAVSYAINSQAICASMDRIFFYDVEAIKGIKGEYRWMVLTGIMALSAFFISNAIPFFKDLVSLIGALTSIPLTLLLPGVLYRMVISEPICRCSSAGFASLALVLFAAVFTLAALFGSINSIYTDWGEREGGFFACQ